MANKIGSHVIENPNKTYSFVGSVPAGLAYEYDDEGDIKIALNHGEGIARKIAKRNGRIFKTRVFATKNDAIKFASDNGYQVENA